MVQTRSDKWKQRAAVQYRIVLAMPVRGNPCHPTVAMAPLRPQIKFAYVTHHCILVIRLYLYDVQQMIFFCRHPSTPCEGDNLQHGVVVLTLGISTGSCDSPFPPISKCGKSHESSDVSQGHHGQVPYRYTNGFRRRTLQATWYSLISGSRCMRAHYICCQTQGKKMRVMASPIS